MPRQPRGKRSTRIGRSVRFPVEHLEQFVAKRIAESER